MKQLRGRQSDIKNLQKTGTKTQDLHIFHELGKKIAEAQKPSMEET